MTQNEWESAGARAVASMAAHTARFSSYSYPLRNFSGALRAHSAARPEEAACAA